jgi:predicted HAD superfamily Cof-like phosphohydrolase
MNKAYINVVKFNQEILGIAPRPLGLQSMQEAELSHTQLIEEANEFLLSTKTQDFIGAIDGCIDSIFFAMGILYKLGVSPDQFDRIFDAVTQANMSKKIGVKEGREGFDALDAVKPEDFKSPEESIMEILNDA